VLKWFSHHLRH